MRKILISTIATIGLMAATLVAYAAPYDTDPMVSEFSVEQSLHDANQLTFAALSADPIDMPSTDVLASSSMLGPGTATDHFPLERHVALAAVVNIPRGEPQYSLVMASCIDPGGIQPT